MRNTILARFKAGRKDFSNRPSLRSATFPCEEYFGLPCEEIVALTRLTKVPNEWALIRCEISMVNGGLSEWVEGASPSYK